MKTKKIRASQVWQTAPVPYECSHKLMSLRCRLKKHGTSWRERFFGRGRGDRGHDYEAAEPPIHPLITTMTDPTGIGNTIIATTTHNNLNKTATRKSSRCTAPHCTAPKPLLHPHAGEYPSSTAHGKSIIGLLSSVGCLTLLPSLLGWDDR